MGTRLQILHGDWSRLIRKKESDCYGNSEKNRVVRPSAVAGAVAMPEEEEKARVVMVTHKDEDEAHQGNECPRQLLQRRR